MVIALWVLIAVVVVIGALIVCLLHSLEGDTRQIAAILLEYWQEKKLLERNEAQDRRDEARRRDEFIEEQKRKRNEPTTPR